MRTLQIDDAHLINCIRLRIYDYSMYIKLLIKKEENQIFYIKQFIKKIRKFPLSNEGLMSALIYAESQISRIEFEIQKHYIR